MAGLSCTVGTDELTTATGEAWERATGEVTTGGCH